MSKEYICKSLAYAAYLLLNILGTKGCEMELGQRKAKNESKFMDILEKNNNFLRISRRPFIHFDKLDMDLNLLRIPKTQFELWDYEKIVTQQFDRIMESIKVKEVRQSIGLLKQDLLEILDSSFSLSDDYRPFEFSLNIIQGIPCTKLHADFLPLRLVCTYLGPGTIFLPKEFTRYPCLNEGRPNKRVHIKDTPILQADPFEILLLKGRKFNKGELRPCAHRSPEVVNNETRLMLKVDFK